VDIRYVLALVVMEMASLLPPSVGIRNRFLRINASGWSDAMVAISAVEKLV
jgi:hypothetical protein